MNKEKKANNGGATEGMSRRGFLSVLSAGWLAFGAVMVGTATATLRFFFPNALFEPPLKFLAGYPDDYRVGEVSTLWTGDFGVWIVRTASQMYALSAVCTHLGCAPIWFPEEKKFKCPCHGSGFAMDGTNFEGPAPRPLERFMITLSPNGEIVIDKSRKFLKEKKDWDKPGAFLRV